MKLIFLFLTLIGCQILNAKPERTIGIIFDCDGTLVDNEYSHFLSWKEALHFLGAELKEEEFFPFYPGLHAGDIAQMLCEKYSLPSPDALCLAKAKNYTQLLAQGFPPIERTVRFVKLLAERKEELGIKLAVASASRKESILTNLDHLGLKNVFDAVVSGKDDLGDYKDPDGVNKPKPYVYLEAAKRLGIDPSFCVAFEDTQTGLRAASDAGMTTFAVPNAYTKQQDFSRASFWIDLNAEIDMDDFWQKVFSDFKK